MILGIKPTVDYAFKWLLGRESTKPILIFSTDAVLQPAPGHQIQLIDLLNPFNPKERVDDKLSILDIKARDQSGRQFNVEMQMVALRYYAKRVLYYGCRLHEQQFREGQDYLELKPTISITFLDDMLFPSVPDYHLCFRLLERSHHFALSADLEFHVLELPKFGKSAEELVSDLDKWLYFLRHAETMDTEALPSALGKQPVLAEAFKELQMLAQTDEERERYEARRKAQLDYNTGLRAARLEGLDEGRMVGLDEGRNVGLDEGRNVGERIGAIHLCERLLQRPETPTAQLAAMSLEDLTRLANELQAQLDR